MKILLIFSLACLPAALSISAPPSPDDLLDLYKEGKYDQLIDQSQALTAAGNASPPTLNMEGAAHLKLKQFDAARKAFQAAVQQAPNFFPARFNLIETEFQEGNYAKALESFQLLDQAYPRNEMIAFGIFMSQLQLGDEEGARKTLSQIPYPGSTPAWHYASGVWELKKNNKKKAFRHFSIARDLYPEQSLTFEDSMQNLGYPTK